MLLWLCLYSIMVLLLMFLRDPFASSGVLSRQVVVGAYYVAAIRFASGCSVGKCFLALVWTRGHFLVKKSAKDGGATTGGQCVESYYLHGDWGGSCLVCTQCVDCV